MINSSAGSGQTQSTTSTSSVSLPKSTGFNSQGWYIFGGVAVGTMLGNTRAAPFIFGILTIALLYQTRLMLEGK